MTFNNETLKEAVRLWCRDRPSAVQRYSDINDWDVSEVTSMASLFQRTSFNDCIDRWDVRRVTWMDRMFSSAGEFNQPLDTWDVSQVTVMSWMFSGARSFNQPLATWDVSQVAYMLWMFDGASSSISHCLHRMWGRSPT